MTPYGRRTARLTAARERETSYWLARGGPRGDPRATGRLAKLKMWVMLGWVTAGIPS